LLSHPLPQGKQNKTMKFKVFLKQAFGYRLHKKRLRMFKKYWCYFLKFYDDQSRSESERKPLESFEPEADREIVRLVQEGVDVNFLKTHALAIERWRIRNRQEASRNSLNDYREKVKARKSIDM
jgi:hypothetical protein